MIQKKPCHRFPRRREAISAACVVILRFGGGAKSEAKSEAKPEATSRAPSRKPSRERQAGSQVASAKSGVKSGAKSATNVGKPNQEPSRERLCANDKLKRHIDSKPTIVSL